MGLSSQPTSSTLLGRLQQGDRTAAEQFYRVYSPLLAATARKYGRWGVGSDDAEDIAMGVCLRVIKRRPQHDPARGPARGWFRRYLSRAVRNGAVDVWRRRTREGSPIDGDIPDRTAPPDMRLIEIEEAEFRRVALYAATESVRSRVEARTWEVFERRAKGEEPSAVAHDLELSAAKVYEDYRRVLRMIAAEVREVDG
ncbi:MAG: sigma-70 family RNA polymerase sigma factor [Gemmataceae bacterium]|nr:sigma-70 family RNA polymerase sigma factor [Gemmataceae bacterium]